MRKSKLTEQQIIGLLEQAEVDARGVSDLMRRYPHLGYQEFAQVAPISSILATSIQRKAMQCRTPLKSS